MANRPHLYSTAVLTNAAESGNNTETVVATLGGVTCEFSNQIIKVRGWAKVSCGTGTTSGLLRIRRTSLTGASISETTPDAIVFVASKVSQGALNVEDSPGELAAGVYVLTYTGAGDTGVATFLAATLEARVD